MESPLPIRWLWRAMITNMNAWVSKGITPPPSNYPRIADGMLVPLDKLSFPAIPDVQVPDNYDEAWHLDFGPNWRTARILTLQPPRVGAPFPILLPQVDADGNAIAGIHLPEISVPLATYTGRNLRARVTGAPTQRVSFLGSYFPLATTAAERKADDDPRLSIGERYSSRSDYLVLYRKAVVNLVHERWILPEDAPALMARGIKEWDYATK